ncbi:MAG TPA: VOC family protein [Pseudonocardia sp.]|uniref:VOC family protein n=1 Tax=Pseudonocardia sp. TaxID=60912 RepID=UPI002BD242DF|nr:VOC family protein [Pseudonocardia sp.]HTF54993.1 VOC family protein [Pseudonocardia sp.]
MGPGASVDGNPLNVFAEVIYEDLPGALAWLPDAFGFVPGRLARNAEGTVIFAEMHVGSGTVLLRAPDGDRELNPLSLGGISQQLYVLVGDPDAHHGHAKAAGAQIVLEPTDMSFGARLYSARDLEAHLWTFGTYQVRAEPE